MVPIRCKISKAVLAVLCLQVQYKLSCWVMRPQHIPCSLCYLVKVHQTFVGHYNPTAVQTGLKVLKLCNFRLCA